MEARSVVKYLRIGPRKVRPIINLVRQKFIDDALAILSVLPHKAARFIEQAVKSAAANAKVKKMDETRLYIAEIRADGGPVLKRFMARAMGRANRILKRTTHISVIVMEKATQRKVVKPPVSDKNKVKDKSADEKGQTVVKKESAKKLVKVSTKEKAKK
jgi:large subunit ribosomal protein L22